MPILLSDREQCELREGRHSLGGDAPDAVPLAPLLAYPLAGTITIRDGAEATIQRLTSRIPLRVNGTMLGAVPEVLDEGASIQVGDVRMTYRRQADPPAAAAAAPPRPRQADLATQVMATLARPGATAALVSLQSGKVVKLAGDVVLVGRSEDANVVLSGAGVSRRHALLVPEGDNWVLTDESTNGSYVNGARINGATRLHPGDVIAFGEEHFRFGLLDAFSSAGGAPASLARVEIARGFEKRTHVIDRPVCTIGRGAHNDLRMDDESVSPSHATLLLKGETWFVSDLRSATGTWLDGYRVAGERPLVPGAEILVGAVKLIFWPGASVGAEQGRRPAAGMLRRIVDVLFVRPREHAEERRRAVR
ncbi:MAG TPA: FHA domain-containing protein [Gemmatimonadaceae bacterium]